MLPMKKNEMLLEGFQSVRSFPQRNSDGWKWVGSEYPGFCTLTSDWKSLFPTPSWLAENLFHVPIGMQEFILKPWLWCADKKRWLDGYFVLFLIEWFHFAKLIRRFELKLDRFHWWRVPFGQYNVTKAENLLKNYTIFGKTKLFFETISSPNYLGIECAIKWCCKQICSI